MNLRDVLGNVFNAWKLKPSFSWTWNISWTGGKVSRFTYFTDAELEGLDDELCAMLDRARALAGIPFTITCGLRTQEHNDTLADSVKDSAHITGHAVDLHCEDSHARFRMFRGLILAGFTRIGVYHKDGHFHVDNDLTKPQEVVWIND